MPAYLRLHRGELAARARALEDLLRGCRLCPRQCGVNRLEGELGVCRSGAQAKVCAAHPHFGEERPLSGRHGSGTIFFSHCNLRCVFCQNWEIAHLGDGSLVGDKELAGIMLSLQRQGCHNINLVTPTHVVPAIVRALARAVDLGLHVPLVYNSSGYDAVETLRLLDGIIDIYMPDFKYADGAAAERYSAGARDYPEIAMHAIEEMHRQVGDLVLDADGIAQRGLLIRHLVLPSNLAGTDQFVQFTSRRLGPNTYVNIMDQYHPAHRAGSYPELSRRITRSEYEQAIAWARAAGITPGR